MSDSNGIYGSNLSDADWAALRHAISPFIHADDPSVVVLSDVPSHLESHPLIGMLEQYRRTGDDQFLDLAGRILVPTDEPFGWYTPLTK